MKYLLRAILVALMLLGVVAAVFYRSDIPVEELKLKYTDSASQFIDIYGMPVHYKVEGSGPVLVLIHGTASSLHTWDGWVAELKNDFTLVRMDLPAFGLTGPNADNDYSIERYTNFIHALMGKLGYSKFSLAGNSLGGRIAWSYTVAYPNEVDKLILIDASGYPKETKDISFAFRMGTTPVLKKLMEYISPRSLFVKSINEVYGDDSKVTDELVDRYYELGLRTGNRKALVARMNQAMLFDTSAITTITAPTLILWGEQDIWIPLEDGERFHRDIRSSVLKTYSGVGHVPMEEIPKISAADARSFLMVE